MENQVQKANKTPQTTKDLFAQINIQKRFDDILGAKSQGFISSVMSTVNNNRLLANADPMTVLTAAVTAATLDLPINQNLGFAWIVPYKNRGKSEAQFQMGWKGYVQLALRTGQYEKLNVVEVYENQFKSFNKLTEDLDVDMEVTGGGAVVGYAAYFELINGFKKTVYWTKEEVKKHSNKYSQSAKNGRGPWSDESLFDSMAKKTVLKNMLAKFGIMSIELQTATLSDQAVQKSEGQYEYLDNKPVDVTALQEEKEAERIDKWIDNAKTVDELEEVDAFVGEDLQEKYNEKLVELKELENE